jgi:hypothetical protein
MAYVNRVSRRRFLGLAGASVATALTMTGVATPRSGQAVEPLSSLGPSLPSGVFPIGTWYHPPIAEVTQARIDELADAGFTFVTGNNWISGPTINATLLGCAANSGISALVTDTRINSFPSYTLAQRQAVLADYTGYSSFAGFHVWDEPPEADFPDVGDMLSAIRGVDSEVLPFVNLLSSNGSTDSDYQAYLQDFIDVVDPALISYDRYPWVDTTGPNPYYTEYFNNWAMIRDAALAAEINPWIYIQSASFSSSSWVWRMPTLAELRWQITVGLAYGMKGVQYFFYWPSSSSFVGLVDYDGVRQQIFDDAQEVNTGYVQPLGAELIDRQSEWVAHVNYAQLPLGTHGLPVNSWVSSTIGDASFLGLFRSDGDESHRWLFIGNPSADSSSTASVDFDPSVVSVDEFDLTSRSYVPADVTGLSVTCDAGLGRLFRLGT